MSKRPLFLTLGSIAAAAVVAALWASIPHAKGGASGAKAPRRNVIIFIADGLRPGSVNPVDAPTLLSVRQNGTFFSNSHALFPTFTTLNSAAIATGHYPGDTGDFSNTIFVDFPVFANQLVNGVPTNLGSGTTTPFLESNPVLADVDAHFGGNYLNEESLLSHARGVGYNTAAVGKVGPILIQDVTQGNLAAGTVPIPKTVVIDDATGRTGGIPLTADIASRLDDAGLGTQAPARGANGISGTNVTPGTIVANVVQQAYFADATSKAVLPKFQAEYHSAGTPFALVFWSRDPDGTQHNQGDSLNTLIPGINGPTSRAAVKNADADLAQILAFIHNDPLLAANTDVVITADHGFGTISKHDLDASGRSFTASYAATQNYFDATGRQEVNTGFLPAGFVAIDLAHALALPLFDPDNQVGTGSSASYIPVDPTQAPIATRRQRPASGNGLIGGTGRILPSTDARVVIAANGGSDLVYLSTNDPDLLRRVVTILLSQDYVSGLFVDDSYGPIPGTLPTSAINLHGSTNLPKPAIAVNFRSFALDAANPSQSGVEIADSTLQHGQGMHGTFGRHDTFNNMAAIGPDFKAGYVDPNPVSNADIAPTLAAILGFNIKGSGELTGRVLTEAFADGPTANYATIGVDYSTPDPTTGLRTFVAYQQVGDTKFFDAAGFPGRTVGLPVLAGSSGGDTLTAGTNYLVVEGLGGDDVLLGGPNRTTMLGDAGADIFVLAPNGGTVTVGDFHRGEGDKIGLSGGLAYAGLSFRPGTGPYAGGILIYQGRSGRLLAVVPGVTSLQATDFVSH